MHPDVDPEVGDIRTTYGPATGPAPDDLPSGGPGGPDSPGGPDDDWRVRLRAHGYRLTPQRQLVLEAVAKLGHATPEAIVTEVRRVASGVNISTVYRTLELLEELELVSHAHLTHGAPAYHAAGGRRHVHLVCGGCGEVSEAPPAILDDLVARLRAERGFVVDVDHVALTGRCDACARQGRSTAHSELNRS
jgi:Fur family ferric uptake transcriptional regulator